jgi:proline iminopeptidase
MVECGPRFTARALGRCQVGTAASFLSVTEPLAAKERLALWRRSRARTPQLERRTVRARGLDFAVRMSPPVPGTLPLLAVNGGLLYGHELLWPTFAPFAEDRQVILYDQRGRGGSNPPPGARAARIEHDGSDLKALREALGIAQWDIAAHSWGAGISLLGAAGDVAGVRRVVTFGSVGPTSRWLDGLHARALAFLLSRDRRSEYEALAVLDPAALTRDDPEMHAHYSRALYPAYFHDESLLLTPPPLSISATGAAVSARLRREGYDWRETLAQVQAPVLLIHGEQDCVPVEESEELAKVLTRAHVLRVAQCGHMPFFEWPAKVFEAALRFLRA